MLNLQVFPKCDTDIVDKTVDNLLSLFDPKNTGTVFYRDLLIAFSLSMRGTPKERLTWVYR